ncbi:acyltransferase [Amycolatopsis decaplanina DSM 44594]|uniref:Acyltransferase n=1 Tax=Amycolatopsis decaplanina DSM 44594 TaxID=1284240 RepID=M2YRY8_9PSEU|nr:acyltransferase [Amycolatopsis decaplanina DSM 44594]
MSFFFVLSGFVLTWSARPDDSAWRFWLRRLVKIYPNHLVVWISAIVLALILGANGEITVGKTVPSLFLVHAWVPDVEVINALSVPSWSLSCEVLFYLCFPLLLRLVNRIDVRRLWLAAGGVALLIPLIPALSEVFLPREPKMPWFPMSVWDYWAVYTFPCVRLLEFALGVLLARIVVTNRWIDIPVVPAVGALVVGCVVQWMMVPSSWAMVVPTVIPLALVIGAFAAADARGRVTFLCGRPMTWLGRISFAMYLIHLVVLHFGGMIVGKAWSTPAALALQVLFLAITVGLSWLLYSTVEKPMVLRLGVRELTPRV